MEGKMMNSLEDQVEIQEKTAVLGDGNLDAARSKLASYASVVSEGRKNSESGVADGFVGDSVDILAEDIIMNCDAPIPSIQFSDHVHDQIDHNMCNAIIDTLADGITKSVDESVEVSKSNLYGPWMVVENRRRRVGQVSQANKNANNGADGSQFSVLQDVEEVRVDGSIDDGSTIMRDGVHAPVHQQDMTRRVQQVGATIVQHQAVIPSGSHQAVRIMEGSGHEQPVEASKSQGKKVVVSKGLVETLNHGIKVGKSAASRVVPRMSPATLARHLSEQLDAGDLPDGQLVGGDHDVVLEHSSDDEVAFLVEFQPVEMSEDSRHGTGVFGEDQ
ncbi:hypothetical protein V6N11_067195 [Hibiscus sabdariffa]|uniref:Uncharacterized protein n=1 Tax=Hibiscus sabdariffa TaxID=183260 RepID=A0ABR2SQ24_9ROSI